MSDISTNPQKSQTRTIIRRKVDKKFTTVPNESFGVDEMSFEARGLLIFMLTHPDNWDWKLAYLIKRNPAGRDKTYRIIKELTQFGFVKYVRERGADGKLKTPYYIISDTPLTEFQEVDGKTTSAFAVSGFSGSGETSTPLVGKEDSPLPEKPLPCLPDTVNQTTTKEDNILNNNNTFRARTHEVSPATSENRKKKKDDDAFWKKQNRDMFAELNPEQVMAQKEVSIDGEGILQVAGKFKNELLQRLGGSADDLQLILDASTQYVPTGTDNIMRLKQAVRGQVARHIKAMRDQDRRYKSAASQRQGGQSGTPQSTTDYSQFGWWEGREASMIKKGGEFWEKRYHAVKPNGHWPNELGPPPGHKDCFFPPSIQEKYDLMQRYGA